MKIVYLAHKIAGDVSGNIARIEKLLAGFLQKRDGNFVTAPYLDSCRYLDDSIPEDRSRGFEFNRRHFTSKLIDELWICSEISRGVSQEIGWCEILGIPVFDCRLAANEIAPEANER